MKRSFGLLLASVFIIISLPGHLYAWGKTGHGIVARIAFAMLDSSTKATVQRYLGPTTIEEASIWMDEVRSDRRYDYMKTWHYVNIDKGNQYEATTDGNIVNALTNCIATLEQKEKLDNLEIKKQLMILFHLTGDMHMPLHVGYGNDKGGNDIDIRFLKTSSNLHRVWDTDIIEENDITARACLSLHNRFSKEEIDGFRIINIQNWINEPRSLLGNVYNFQDGAIDQAYIDRNIPIIEQQLLIAGIRLAAVLQHLFRS